MSRKFSYLIKAANATLTKNCLLRDLLKSKYDDKEKEFGLENIRLVISNDIILSIAMHDNIYCRCRNEECTCYETALIKNDDLYYDSESDYDDVRIFININELEEEIKRLIKYYNP
jgi:hypothetical protein